MDVTVSFLGPLGEYTGQKRILIHFPDGAVYGDLLDEIDRQFGARFPEALWDREQRQFKKGVLVIGFGRDLGDEKTPLTDGEEIKMVPVLAGG